MTGEHCDFFCISADETFMKGTQILITWLDRGDCNRRTSNTFYSLIQSSNGHVRRIMNEKAAYNDELEQMKIKFRLRLEGIINQCTYLGSASHRQTRFVACFQFLPVACNLPSHSSLLCRHHVRGFVLKLEISSSCSLIAL